MLSANIIMLLKPGKEPLNFRLILLLNTDLKLYAKIMAQWLVPIITQLVHADQMGFTLGRQAPNTTRKITNLLYYTESTKTPALLLALNAEEALDRIHWTYLCQTLPKFGFNGNILWLYVHQNHQNVKESHIFSNLLQSKCKKMGGVYTNNNTDINI